ncbi:MAG: hypothetical protein A2275_07985 [Bacteroidetes bacterium RIFOXYA12_FULL_35_11]|nr:MAG: hypothetical protein A2X01_14965 [Bacteroidetes bacterium GWF2_35_48]OFY76219.1 MAG: hypothetical protein A2275_07985 [Bacteroidetes bacterium RIFOXYA12_FULL_35_11]OFY97370.1 MAG: hypothetical protein A2491_08155 [Bacteroidetes bacterium RIFOXYC12_FULL_35_7]HBX53040.1 hypothetical protein [Bacteroidales bacterium]
MDYLLISIISFGTALLTFFSGFGLGTILMPVFAIFFPVEIAIALSAVVHFANNIFKIGLVWKHINYKILVSFALPAMGFAFLGAFALNYLTDSVILYQYHIGSKLFDITLIKLIISILLIIFSIIEIDKRFEKITFEKKTLPIGGALSGFFGGLSGHQGALRSMFLLRIGLSKESFVATGIATAILIDISRLTVYGTSFLFKHFSTVNNDKSVLFIIVACLGAFIGTYFGQKLLKKITMRTVQIIVGLMILTFAILLGFGII